MAFFSSPPSRTPSSVRALGKIPGHPEFLQNRTSREPERSFDAWLEGGMGIASHRYGPAFTDAFELGAALGFVWRAPRETRCDELLSGVVFPSCDAVGRHYPLAVVSAVSERLVARAPHVIPLAFGDYLERVHAAASDFPTLATDELAARLAALGPPTEEDVARAAMDYEDWCRSTPVARGWYAIFGDDTADARAAALDELRAVTEAIRGVEAPARARTVRLPLGEGGPASAALWLDVVRRLCRWKSTVPSSFWTVEGGSLLVSLGDPEPGLVSSLWHDDEHDALVFRPGSSSAPPPSIAAPAESGGRARGASPAPPHSGTRGEGLMIDLLESLGK